MVAVALKTFAVIALGGSMWWLGLFFVLLVVLSFVLGRYEAGDDGDPPRI